MASHRWQPDAVVQEVSCEILNPEQLPRVQVPNLTFQTPNLNNYYPKTEYLIIGSFKGPLGTKPDLRAPVPPQLDSW